MRTSRRIALVSVAILALSALVGAGISGAKSTAAKSSKAPVKIMVVAAVNTPLASVPQAWAGAQAAALAINRAGGANGHKVQIITCNNEATAAGETTCAQQAVTDKVIASVGQAPFASVEDGVLGPAHIPSTFDGVDSTEFQTSTEFPLNGMGWVEYLGGPVAAKEAGAKKLGVMCAQFPELTALCANVNRVAAKDKLRVVSSPTVALTATTYSAQIQQLQASGAQAVVLAVLAQQMPAIVAAAQAVGYNPTWIVGTGSFPDTTSFKATTTQGKFWVVSDYPPISSASKYPGLHVYQKQMSAASKAGIGHTSVPNQVEQSISAWAAVQGYAQLVAKVKGTVTASKVLAVEKKAKNLNIGGLLTWSPGAHGSAGYPHLTPPDGLVYVGPAKNGTWVPKPAAPISATAGVVLQ